jgi:phosphate transport system protein
MAKRTSCWPRCSRSTARPARCAGHGREVELMLRDALDAYIQRDAELAE